jgi:hypothetical protein
MNNKQSAAQAKTNMRPRRRAPAAGSAMEERALEALVALALQSIPPPPTDEEIAVFMQEWDEGKHQLSAEDEAALARAKTRLDSQPEAQAALSGGGSADHLLRQVWHHMHGQNMDGSRRNFPDDDACGRNWQKLSDAIFEYLHEQPRS